MVRTRDVLKPGEVTEMKEKLGAAGFVRGAEIGVAHLQGQATLATHHSASFRPVYFYKPAQAVGVAMHYATEILKSLPITGDAEAAEVLALFKKHVAALEWTK